jgi:acetyl-CoA carboxylase/biotin carboxylase 1
MKAKDCITNIINWKTSRKFFYYRLKRKLLELDINKNIKKYNNLKFFERKKLFETYLFEKNYIEQKTFNDDEKFISWFENNNNIISNFFNSLKIDDINNKIVSVFNFDKNETLNSFANYINNNLSSEEKEIFLKLL